MSELFHQLLLSDYLSAPLDHLITTVNKEKWIQFFYSLYSIKCQIFRGRSVERSREGLSVLGYGLIPLNTWRESDLGGGRSTISTRVTPPVIVVVPLSSNPSSVRVSPPPTEIPTRLQRNTNPAFGGGSFGAPPPAIPLCE